MHRRPRLLPLLAAAVTCGDPRLGVQPDQRAPRQPQRDAAAALVLRRGVQREAAVPQLLVTWRQEGGGLSHMCGRTWANTELNSRLASRAGHAGGGNRGRVMAKVSTAAQNRSAPPRDAEEVCYHQHNQSISQTSNQSQCHNHDSNRNVTAVTHQGRPPGSAAGAAAGAQPPRQHRRRRWLQAEVRCPPFATSQRRPWRWGDVGAMGRVSRV